MLSHPLLTRYAAPMLLLVIAAPSYAVVPGQTDDFQDGTTQGWSSSFADPTPPVNQPDAGPNGLGDYVLAIEADAFESIAIQNSTQWAGDYLAAGIEEILFDFENQGAASISLGATLSGPGGVVITLAGQSIPASTGWSAGSINLTPGNLFALSGTIASTLADVTLVEFDHIVAGSNLVSASPVQIRLDNIQVVPEPSAAVLTLLAGLLALRRRCR